MQFINQHRKASSHAVPRPALTRQAASLTRGSAEPANVVAVVPAINSYGKLRQRLECAMQRLDQALALCKRDSSDSDKALTQDLVRAATREVDSAVTELRQRARSGQGDD